MLNENNQLPKRQIGDTEYFADEQGNVYKNNYKMKIRLNKKGYNQIGLTINKKQKQYKVARLIAQTFIPNPLNKPCVNHINGKKNDDRVENLEWVTHSENCLHAYQTKLHGGTKGEINGSAKLNRTLVEWIRRNYIPFDKDFGIMAISKKLGRGYKTIQRVINNQSWKNE
jgi:hypothetical protein